MNVKFIFAAANSLYVTTLVVITFTRNIHGLFKTTE